jgi:hypothetical protein
VTLTRDRDTAGNRRHVARTHRTEPLDRRRARLDQDDAGVPARRSTDLAALPILQIAQ